MATGSLHQLGKCILRILHLKKLAPKRREMEKDERERKGEQGSESKGKEEVDGAVGGDLHPDGAVRRVLDDIDLERCTTSVTIAGDDVGLDNGSSGNDGQGNVGLTTEGVGTPVGNVGQNVDDADTEASGNVDQVEIVGSKIEVPEVIVESPENVGFTAKGNVGPAAEGNVGPNEIVGPDLEQEWETENVAVGTESGSDSTEQDMDIIRKGRKKSLDKDAVELRRKGRVVIEELQSVLGCASDGESEGKETPPPVSLSSEIAKSAEIMMAGLGFLGVPAVMDMSKSENGVNAPGSDSRDVSQSDSADISGFDQPGMMESSMDSQLSVQSSASAGSVGLEEQVAGDVCVVCEDFKAGNEGEINVCVGQQVEVLDASPSGGSEWCLVRPLLSVEGISGAGSPAEGLVPMSILKHLPNLRVSVSRTSINNDAPEPAVSDAGSGMSSLGMTTGSTSAQSPANKRRSSFRKWLTNPVRKLSQSRLTEKATIDKSAESKDAKTPSKSDKKVGKFGLKEQIETSNDSVASSAPVTQQPESSSGTQGPPLEDEGAEEEVAVEMPPPMQEISTIPLPSNDVATDEKLNPESQDGSGSEQGDRSSLQGQSEGQDGDDLSDNATAEGGLTEDESNRLKNLRRRDFVIKELIDTEKDYVRDLGLIVDGYMKMIHSGEMPLPEGMEGKDKIVFGNIHQIYDWHKDIFKKELEKCAEEAERIGYLFIRYEKQMQMYVKYCENKPKSEYIVAEYIDWFEELRQVFGHRLSIPDLLIKPVQRIMKYQLLLKDILKYTDKAGEDTKDLQRGVEVMVVVPKKANDMMNVCRLQGFHGKIHAQGELLLQDTLMVMEQGSKVKADRTKMRERRVFLFEQIVIVSEEVEKKKNSLSSSSYIYKNSIMSNKMGLQEVGNATDLTFTLIDKAPGSDLKLVMQAPTEQVRQNWVSQIRSILDMQGDFLKALQSPIAYQKELTLTKELSAPDFGNVQGRNSMLRKTQSQPQPPKGGSSSHAQGALSSSSHTNLSDKDLAATGGLRCKSMPAPLPGEGGARDERKTSCPSSPTSRDPPNEKPKLENKKTAPAAIGLSMSPAVATSGSPKPKRLFEGFRNTLRPKSKSQDSTAGGATGAAGGKSPSPAPTGATATSPSADAYSSAPSLSESLQDDGRLENSTTESEAPVSS